MSESLVNKVKDQFTSTVGDVESAMSGLSKPSNEETASHEPTNDHQRGDATPSHRNAEAKDYHEKAVKAPKDVEEFIAGQIQGKQNEQELIQKFPTDDTVWHGFVNWENHPDRKAEAEKILKQHTWTPIPEFQLVPLPSTNPILLGHRWKEYHLALGPNLNKIHEESWEIFKKEKRDNMLVVLDFPMNCEPKRAGLLESHITPNDIHFVRNHGGIPTVDNIDDYSIAIGGLVKSPGELLFNDLIDPAKFPQVEMTITLQCSGTRRIEQINLYPGEGDELLSAPWAEGAISTARYKGVQVKDVLQHFGGVLPEGLHIETIGADTYFKKNKVFNYAVSVPYRKAKYDEALLAYEMNGEPLPKIHGGPLRLVVPGVIGARSCKWVTNINILPEPNMGPVQRQEYLYYTQQIGKHNASFARGFSIQDMPVSSAILKPADKEVIVHDGSIHCEGWAYSGGGAWVERVEISIDGGFIWHEVPEENLSPKHYYAMRLWKMDVPVPVEGWIELVVRCWDSHINTQPTYVRSAWNWTLHVTSSAHRVPIYSINRTIPATAKRLRILEEHGEPIAPITHPAEFALEGEDEYLESMKLKGSREPVE